MFNKLTASNVSYYLRSPDQSGPNPKIIQAERDIIMLTVMLTLVWNIIGSKTH